MTNKRDSQQFKSLEKWKLKLSDRTTQKIRNLSFKCPFIVA